MTASTTAVDDREDFSDRFGTPLIKHLHVRLSGPQYATLVTKALAERVAEAEVARRWLRRGAAAEGLNFDEF